ncbi:MAG: potassium transporter KtrB [Clostridia bacterium]|nr:potassium transporter KtrB [Clostridia bacterium]
MKARSKLSLSTTQVILLSFLLTILLGSLLLFLPISTKNGVSVPYLDALFTATTATCVTGLVTLPTATAWSTFGQVVILVLIEIGGLGTITVLSGIVIALHRKMGLKDHQLISDALNVTSLSGLASLVKRVIFGTLVIETVGALLYLPVFVPQFGARGIFISVFTSISAFCNAGIDILGNNSLCAYATHPLVNAVTGTLIVLGGLGFIVWWDLLRVFRDFRKMGLRCFHRLTLHSKIVLGTTAVLIFSGALLIFLLEYQNPQTLAGRSLFDKIQIALFQSITTRTAGFATVAQEDLTSATAILCLVLMFIGGSPVGTAGGVKTVTVAVLFATALSVIRGKSETTLFGRTLSREAVRKAVAVVATSFFILLLSTVLLAALTPAPALDVMYETVSAAATVGLSRNLTPSLPPLGKIVIIATMYFGRVGPISLATLLQVKKESSGSIKDPTENITVG